MTQETTAYSAPVLAVLACVYLLTDDTGQGADSDDVLGLLQEKYGMTASAAEAALAAAEDEGALEASDGR
jgi:uncharacterized tellurite resistance protein B-like protein